MWSLKNEQNSIKSMLDGKLININYHTLSWVQKFKTEVNKENISLENHTNKIHVNILTANENMQTAI